jgi:hypothetical protein
VTTGSVVAMGVTVSGDIRRKIAGALKRRIIAS